MIADTAKRHSKRIARYTTMPPITSSSAIAPSEASSLPTCGPTNSTRRSSGLPPSRAALQAGHHLLADLAGFHAFPVGQADQHVAGAAEVLHLGVR